MCVDKPEDHDCLVCIREQGGELRKLKKDHQYYYQCQCQIFVTDASYCDFVFWIGNKLHVERILPDDEFWSNVYQKAKLFFMRFYCLRCVGDILLVTMVQYHLSKKLCLADMEMSRM